jgi:hypothetical protein
MKHCLSLFEDSHDCKELSQSFPAAIGEEAFDILRAAGVLEPAGPGDRFPCPGFGNACPRTIVETPHSKRSPFRAVCSDASPACAYEFLTEQQIQTHALNRRAWVALLRRLFGLEGAIAYDGNHGHGVWQIGTRGNADLFLARKPEALALWPFLTARESLAQRTVILVPTRRGIEAALGQRFAHGKHVELAFLEQSLVLRDGNIGVVASPFGPATTPEPTCTTGLVRLPAGTGWRDVRFYRVDGHTLSVRAGDFHRRVSYVDLGMASTKNREPTKQWNLLLALCERRGEMPRTPQADADAVKKQVSLLRTQLRRTLGIQDNPFEPYEPRRGWRPKFSAFPSADGDC